MKNTFKDVCCLCKKLEISKNYDCKTELKAKGEDKPYFSMNFKGNFTITPLHILIGSAALAGVYIAMSVSKAAKRKK